MRGKNLSVLIESILFSMLYIVIFGEFNLAGLIVCMKITGSFAIARAIARKPDVLVFDDSFSALDMKTDRQVRQNLKESMGDATMIVVAQRVNTIKDATRILVLENGAVAGMGTHLELLRSCRLYREIAEIQLGKEEVAAELA